MALENTYHFELLKNEAEQLVFHELDQQLAALNTKICLCNDCVMDMATKALNTVKPKYRYSLLGTLYAAQSMNDRHYADSVQRAVADAIETVSGNPSHD